eukprot:11019035-Alexandrium_andersonii.AAC.1
MSNSSPSQAPGRAAAAAGARQSGVGRAPGPVADAEEEGSMAGRAASTLRALGGPRARGRSVGTGSGDAGLPPSSGAEG